jgi:hypothetical protein
MTRPMAGGTASTPGLSTPADFGSLPGTAGMLPGMNVQPPQAPAVTTPTDQAIATDECPGSVPAPVAQKLRDTAHATAGGRWLYPYNQTVFPRGLTSPILQWDGAPSGASAVYIHLKSILLDYHICLPLTEPVRVQIPQKVWDVAGTQSRGLPDPLTVEVVIGGMQSTAKLPPLTLTFALASLKGAVYYNTYGSVLASNMGIGGGVVMRVLPGTVKPPEVFLGVRGTGDQCIGCHSVSANGSRMVAEIHEGGGTTEGASHSYDLTKGNGAQPMPQAAELRRAGFSGMFPDGSLYVATARLLEGPGPVGNPATGVGNISGTFGPEETKLYDANTGSEILGSGVHPYSFMPTFSVDGKMLVFNDVASSSAMEGGHALSVMDFDRTTTKFSNKREIFRNAMEYPSWPFFVPDVVQQAQENVVMAPKRVVFALVTNNDLVTGAVNFSFTPAAGNLWWVDLQTNKALPLDRANGRDKGMIYLPYGEPEANKNFVPTVSPVAAGGYYWVFFTSKRNYGNIRVNTSGIGDGAEKKIWVAAVDIDAPPDSDPSHPAFYLSNQENESGNIRAFAALEPCRVEGESCSSGVDCCCGFCATTPGSGTCDCHPNRCSNIEEKCSTAADCCDPGVACVGGFCQYIVQ